MWKDVAVQGQLNSCKVQTDNENHDRPQTLEWRRKHTIFNVVLKRETSSVNLKL